MAFNDTSNLEAVQSSVIDSISDEDQPCDSDCLRPLTAGQTDGFSNEDQCSQSDSMQPQPLPAGHTERTNDGMTFLVRHNSSTSLIASECRLLDIYQTVAPPIGSRLKPDCASSTSVCSARSASSERGGELVSASDSVCTYVECDTESVLHVSSASLGTDLSRRRLSSVALAPVLRHSSDTLSADAAFTLTVVGLRTGEPKLLVSDRLHPMECGDSRTPVTSLSDLQPDLHQDTARTSLKSRLLWCCASLACCFLG